MSKLPPQAKRRKLIPATTESTTASTTDSRPASENDTKPFRFFDLARELRDLVYDECLVKRYGNVADGTVVDARVHVRQGPEHSFFLVSRQFHRECFERMQKTTVVVLEHVRPCLGLKVVPVPSSLTNCDQVHIKDNFYYSDTSEDIVDLCEQLLEIAEDFVPLRRLAISVKLRGAKPDHDLEHFVEHLRDLLMLPRLSQIKIQRLLLRGEPPVQQRVNMGEEWSRFVDTGRRMASARQPGRARSWKRWRHARNKRGWIELGRQVETSAIARLQNRQGLPEFR